MKLATTFSKLVQLESEIFENNGELTPVTETRLKELSKDLETHVEDVVFAYKRRASELQYIKDYYKHAIDSRTRALDQFRLLIQSVCKYTGNLKTPVASIGNRTRKSKSCIILDFDLCMKHYPEAVSIEVFDNQKTIKLNKTILKEIYEKQKGFVNGFDVIEYENEYVEIKVRSKAGSKS